MARKEYGGSTEAFTTTAAGLIRAGLDLYAWTARTGGARIDDLIALTGTIATDTDGSGHAHLVSGATGAISLLGPDGYDADGLWVSPDPSPAAPRYWLRARALTGTGGGGGGGPTGIEYVQATPAASWSIAHSLLRRPAVAVYVAGELVEADVTATALNVNVTFPAPTAGTAVLA